MTVTKIEEAGHTTPPEQLLADRGRRPEGSVVDVGGVRIGGREVVVIAGPCAVESREQINETARAVKRSGARMLRGGAFKPRTAPYSFQGLKHEGLQLLSQAKQETGLPVVTEVMDTREVEAVCEHADVLQIGTRNMQSFELLQEVGRAAKPVLLKRGMSATIKELLYAAYIRQKEGRYDLTPLGRQLLLAFCLIAREAISDRGDEGLAAGANWETAKGE